MSEIDFKDAVLAKLDAIHDTLHEQKMELALTKQASATVAQRVEKAEEHIDDLRQAKWKLAGAVAALSGAASFVGAKVASLFGGSPPAH